MNISEQLENIKSVIPVGVKLVAVSKTKPEIDILEAYQAGQKDFGENKVQELAHKAEILPKDIKWHMIGHLQKNKVKYIAPFVSLIHSVDSIDLLEVIDKEGKKNNRNIDCLLQIKIAKEESKYGLSVEMAKQILTSTAFSLLTNVRITGLMGMATFTSNKQIIKSEFNFLHTFFTELKNDIFKQKTFFKELSMGMSDDYKIALDCGATIIRIGSTIFGERIYH